MSEFNDVDINEGTLPIEDPQNINFNNQFIRWMELKGVSPAKGQEGIVSNNIVRTIIESFNGEGKQIPYDRCFDREGFDRGGGHCRSFFDRGI